MALFGFNVVLTMIVASVIHKLAPHYSFGRWFLTRGLHYYSVPLDSSLLHHVATHTPESKKTTKIHLPLDSSLYLKRTGPIPLTAMPINYAVILLTFYYTECKWILDLFLAALFVLVVTVSAYVANPLWHCTQVNMSSAWTGFILIYTFIQLYKLTTVYLSPELPKERISLVVLSLFLFVCVLAVLPMDGRWFDFRLHLGYSEFIDGLLVTLTPAGLNQTDKPLDRSIVESHVPFILYILVLVALSTFIGFVLVFPSLNYSKLHFETLTRSKRFAVRTLLHFNYIFPLLSLAFWFKPIGVKQDQLPPRRPLKLASSFPLYRLLAVIILCALRLSLFQLHMKTYLNRAKDSLSALRAVKPKVTVGDFKLKVKSIFSFYGGASLQYFGPIVFLATLQLLSLISSSYLGIFDCTEYYQQAKDPPNMFYLCLYNFPLSFLSWWVLFVMFFVSSFGSIVYASMTS